MRHNEDHFQGLGNFRISYQSWLPDERIKAVLLVAHGYAEHSGRYGNLVNYFVPRGYAVYALDHRGHGRSDGERVQVEHYTDYLTDLKTFFDLIRKEHPDREIYLVGHSMGAAISTAYAAKHQDELAGLILSGGGIATEKAPPRPAGLDLAATLSRDAGVVEAYKNDPLVYHGPAPSGPQSAMATMRTQLPQEAPKITLPILIMAGNASPLGDGPRSQALYDVVGAADKTLKLYDGLMHELFNEPEHRQVMADMETWLMAHLQSRHAGADRIVAGKDGR
ncbi:MAG: lysophospholipase [Dehalococcoidia bacterium]